jgi:hypothetical protein
MRQALLVSVAALALAAGSTIALSQGGGQGGTGVSGGGAAGGSINANPGTSGGAAGSTSREAQPTTEQAPGTKKGAQERTAPTQKSTQQDRPAQPGAQQRQTETPQQGGAKQGAQTGDSKGAAQGKGMASSNVSLTTEQKTTIRSTVINTGPKVSNVNFDLKVGVVVPRTVRIAPVPATIVEIQPAWRGYMYFVYEDEIIIVEPRTLKIVAVLEV